MLKKRIWNSFIPSIIWLLIIVGGSFMPSSNVPKVDVSDKWVHFVFYAIFSLLLFFATQSYTKYTNFIVKRWSFIICVISLVGGLIEIVQHYCIDGRQGEFMDVVANMCGATSALFVLEIVKAKQFCKL